ncbi:ROK family protein [Paenibacillus sp. GSMTC-2017]|uniref:ROK family protein n=1 Tax=Paenibacillus sp. GSMTC-2017 TaxID=2794350 RepID=UPI0018D83431|nr:ROK family protein [Paenibacillus sp. GSMTC-2017]MBH5318862.1 ROK family protein [Paenibacillus sp. GSMTC-2017]
MNQYVGIELDGGQIYLMAETPDGLLDHSVTINRDCTLTEIQQEIESFISKLPYTPCGIGMGMPGLVVGHDKVELSHVLPALNGVTADKFATSAGIPVVFINDVKAATMAEAAHYTDNETIAVVMLDAFIASGIVANGELLLGSKGWSGELGYMIIAVNGEPVLLDLIASGYAITNKAGKDEATVRELLEAGDEEIIELVRQAGTYLGYALVNLIHLYNPSILVIGGSTPTYKGYMDAVHAALNTHALPELLKCCTITTPKTPQRLIAHGAREWIIKLSQP